MKTRILISAFLLMPLLANAKTGVGIDIPDRRDQLTLQGAGLLKKGYFFKIYVGALYTEEGARIEQIIANAPKRLDIYYLRHIPKKYMVRAANSTLKKNLTEKEIKKFLPKLDQLHQAYLDGMRNSYASIEYQPGKGLSYSFNEKLVITIPGDEFAKAYFAVWLGERPSSKTMKQALLGLGTGKSE